MNLKQQIATDVKKALEHLGVTEIEPKIEYINERKFGDYSTNVALIAAKKFGKNPIELAEEIGKLLTANNSQLTEKVEVVKPGFINFTISSDILISGLNTLDTEKRERVGKKILVEFAHPNTHKAFHIGHLRNVITGESLVRLFEARGDQVIRANYQGDVGMHIAKALYGILTDENIGNASNLVEQLKNVKWDLGQKIAFLGKSYSDGSRAYEVDENAKKEIEDINKKIYAKDPSIFEIYRITRQWSLEYFESIYKIVGTYFDRYYFESEVYDGGKEIVLKGLEKGIFEKSDGAIIFPGKKFGLHDRVFITSEGNPTYEGKEMGLGPLQFAEHDPDRVIHVVGPEQAGYFQVVFEALAQLFPKTRGREHHLAYGWVKLKQGKMSSRSGNVVLGEWLINEAKNKIREILARNESQYKDKEKEEIIEKVAIGAVKYSFLKVSTQQEMVFDLGESVSFEGNSGPYIQYTYARTQSILLKAGISNFKFQISNFKLEHEERDLLVLLSKFDEVREDAAYRLAPSTIATYLFDLAQNFNLFYQKHQILKSPGEKRDFRINLTGKVGKTLKKGLHLLGIEAPNKM